MKHDEKKRNEEEIKRIRQAEADAAMADAAARVLATM